MPLTSAIQSAMAVRMEREKRQQRRLSKIRRESGVSGVSGQSMICTKRESVASVGTLEEDVVRVPPDKSESMVTTFHLGIVFILLGFIMIFSSMIPSSLIKVRAGCMRLVSPVYMTIPLQADWSSLLGVGVAFIFIGLIMVMVNRIITAREEEELSKYVAQRLSRTRPSSNTSLVCPISLIDPHTNFHIESPSFSLKTIFVTLVQVRPSPGEGLRAGESPGAGHSVSASTSCTSFSHEGGRGSPAQESEG